LEPVGASDAFFTFAQAEAIANQCHHARYGRAHSQSRWTNLAKPLINGAVAARVIRCAKLRTKAHFLMKCRSFVLLLLLLSLESRAAELPLADSTIVVYNKTVPEPVELAKFYAEKRGIAPDHLIGLDCSMQEEITRDQYDATIAEPLRVVFRQRHWWTVNESPGKSPVVTASSIHFVAIIKGVPLKIHSADSYSGDQRGNGPIRSRNEASVDSEMAVLAAYSRQISGFALNPYFRSFRPIAEFGNPGLLLVCRLDAPNAEMMRRMIVDPIGTEKNGLWGRAYVDAGNKTVSGGATGDEWLAEIFGQLHKVGIPVVYEDTPALFPEAYPMTDCALYYGWYAGKVTGPFVRPDFRFVPGAIAVHIHSFSASTLRDSNADWVAPLVSKGAAASLGNVYEPYLELTSRLDTFNDRLLHGFTFAESAYMATPALSWMSIMVGDPLYRPYASWLQLDVQSQSGKHASDWQMYHEFAAKNAARPTAEFRVLAGKAALSAHNCPMLEDLGSMDVLDGNLSQATNYFQQARTCYKKPDDIVRVALEESGAWLKLNQPKRAVDLVGSVLRTASDAPAAPLLRKIEDDAELAVSEATPSR
jgi:uncharacterized protein (TIGR03790 family)